MFSLNDLKETKVYQEPLEEGIEQGIEQGKIQAIPRLRALRLSVEQIAQGLDSSLETVRKWFYSIY